MPNQPFDHDLDQEKHYKPENYLDDKFKEFEVNVQRGGIEYYKALEGLDEALAVYIKRKDRAHKIILNQ